MKMSTDNRPGDPEINDAIGVKLQELERLVREAGDEEVGDHLQRISESTDRLRSLHSALKRKNRDTTVVQRKGWFLDYRASDGRRLSATQVNRAVKHTARWELSDIQLKALTILCREWTTNANHFCVGKPPKRNIIRRLYDQLEMILEVDPIRRKVVPYKLSEAVEDAQQAVTARRRIRVSKSPKKSRRETDRLTNGLRLICQRYWSDLPEDKQNILKKKLSERSVCGSKWKLIQPPEMILSLGNAANRFERVSWDDIEIDAINAYLRTLPQATIQQQLREAWDAINRYYSSSQNSLLTAVEFPPPLDSRENVFSSSVPENTRTIRQLPNGVDRVASSSEPQTEIEEFPVSPANTSDRDTIPILQSPKSPPVRAPQLEASTIALGHDKQLECEEPIYEASNDTPHLSVSGDVDEWTAFGHQTMHQAGLVSGDVDEWTAFDHQTMHQAGLVSGDVDQWTAFDHQTMHQAGLVSGDVDQWTTCDDQAVIQSWLESAQTVDQWSRFDTLMKQQVESSQSEAC